MNFQFGYNLINPTWVCSNADANYPAANLIEYFNLMWQLRTLTTAESRIVGDMTTARALKQVLLNDVNFTSFYIQANATDSWGAPSRDLGPYTVSKDGLVNRYKAAIDVSALFASYRFICIKIPNQATTDGATYFRLGGIALTDSVVTPATNISYGDKTSSDRATSIQQYKSGGQQVICLGNNLQWKKTIEWKTLPSAELSTIETLNAIAPDSPMIFFENQGNTAKGYLCIRLTPFAVISVAHGMSSIGSVDLIELI